MAIAAVALIAFRQSPSATVPTSVRTSRQELVRLLRVLRRPQIKTDLDPRLLSLYVPPRLQHLSPQLRRFLAPWGNPKLDRPLVRMVNIPAWHAKLAIEPTTYQPSPSSPQRSEGLTLALWIGRAPTIPPSSESATGPTSVAALRAHGLAVFTHAPNGTNSGVVVVRDGVARVALGPFRLPRLPVAVHPAAFKNASSAVHNNVAAFELNVPTIAIQRAVVGLFIFGATAQATWFSPSGTIIAHTTTNLDLLLRIVDATSPG